MTRIWIIVLLIICVMVLISKYEPSIDIIVVEGNRYRVLLWYNTTKIDYSGKPVTARSYIQLFTI